MVREEGRPFKVDVTFKEFVKSFRSCHRMVKYRSDEKKYLTKAKDENYENVKKLKTALEFVLHKHQVLKQYRRLVWNLDETDVSGEYGLKTKVFTDTQGKSGGYRFLKGKCIGKHLPVVVIAQTANDVFPPIFIF